MRYLRPASKLAKSWSRQHTDDSNFFYDLTEGNLQDLGQLLATVLKLSVQDIEDFMNELFQNVYLHDHISKSFSTNRTMRDAKVAYGRRVGWYALIRAMKPRLVVETGVAQGVGAIIITSALKQNANEGFPGQYLGTDIDINAGELFVAQFREFGEILYGDSIESLKKITLPIDIFINDSDHSAKYEAEEYECVKNMLSKNAIIIGDNSHVTQELSKFSKRNNRSYIFFKELPVNHWYPGGGIGFSLPKL